MLMGSNFQQNSDSLIVMSWLVSSVSISINSIWFLFHLCSTNSGFFHTLVLNRTLLGVLTFTDLAFIMLGRNCNQTFFYYLWHVLAQSTCFYVCLV